jgi:hypothetical protein
MRLRGLSDRDRTLIGRRRLMQGPVMALVEPISDHQGRIASPYVALSTLVQMERCGTITARQRAVGEAFHACFHLAALEGLRAADMTRAGGRGGAGPGMPIGNEAARRRIGEAIAQLGGQGSTAAMLAWDVLGLECSLREWAGKHMNGNAHHAKGVLLAVLGIIEARFSG